MSPLDEKEAKARVVYVLHEMGYNYFNIPKLTWVEIKDLFRGGTQVEKTLPISCDSIDDGAGSC